MKRLIAAAFLCTLLSCRSSRQPGWEDLPPGIPRNSTSFVDLCPRWSHDGKRIAFLRRLADRSQQLFLTTPDLKTIQPIGSAELVTPDRELVAGRDSTRTPDQIAWSPDD